MKKLTKTILVSSFAREGRDQATNDAKKGKKAMRKMMMVVSKEKSSMAESDGGE